MHAPSGTLLPDFYQILEFTQETTETCRATLSLNPAHPILDGHFPGFPVVPGVCMMQMAKEMLERALGRSTRLQAARNIKFMTILNPNENKTVRVELTFRHETTGDINVDGVFDTPDGSKVFFKMKGTFVLA